MAHSPYQPDPEALLRALVAKDERAWRHVMAAHGSVVVAAGRRFGLSESDGEEVFQNTFLSAYRAIRSLRSANRLDAWLYSIAYRAALDVIARRRSQQSVDEVHEALLADESERVDEAMARLDDAKHVRKLVSELDPKCRMLIESLYLEDPPVSYRDISESAGIPMGSIGPTRARCLEQLRKRLESVSFEDVRGSTQATGGENVRHPAPDKRGLKK